MLESIKNRIRHLSNDAQKMIVSSVLDVLPGTTFVPDEVAQMRLETCESCEQFDSEFRRCRICTCFVDEKTAVDELPFMGKVECPLNKWK